MRKLLIFFLLWGATLLNTHAQDLVMGIRYIKVASTLREVEQFDEAEKYLEKGLALVRGRDNYWEAVAYETFGLLYRDQDEQLDAARNFQKAIDLYTRLNLTVSRRAVEQLMQGMRGQEEVYAGIDVGAKGVKLTLVHIRVKAREGLTKRFTRVRSIDVEPSALTDQAIRETAAAIKTLVEEASTSRKVPGNRTFIVLSSGLKQFMDKAPGKEAQLMKEIRDQLKDPNRPIDIMSASDESLFASLSLIPRKRYLTTTLMDFGSGNVKGGYIMRNLNYESFNFPYGTKAFSRMVKAMNVNANSQQFAENANKLVDKIGEEIYLEMSRKTALKTRPDVVVIGGIVFAMMTFLHPEKAGDTVAVEFTPNDVKRFKLMAATRYDELIHPDLSNIDDPAVRKKAADQVALISSKIFNQEDIIAGSALLDTLVKEYGRSGIIKRFYSVPDADVAPIGGYVYVKIRNEYTSRRE